MARVLFQLSTSEGSPLTKSEVEIMSDADLTQSIVSMVAVAKDRTLTDSDVANFWLVYEEKNRRGRRPQVKMPTLVMR